MKKKLSGWARLPSLHGMWTVWGFQCPTELRHHGLNTQDTTQKALITMAQKVKSNTQAPHNGRKRTHFLKLSSDLLMSVLAQTNKDPLIPLWFAQASQYSEKHFTIHCVLKATPRKVWLYALKFLRVVMSKSPRTQWSVHHLLSTQLVPSMSSYGSVSQPLCVGGRFQCFETNHSSSCNSGYLAYTYLP